MGLLFSYTGDSWVQILIIWVITYQCAYSQLLYLLRANQDGGASFLYCLRLLCKFMHGKIGRNMKTGSTLREIKMPSLDFASHTVWSAVLCSEGRNIWPPWDEKQNKTDSYLPVVGKGRQGVVSQNRNFTSLLRKATSSLFPLPEISCARQNTKKGYSHSLIYSTAGSL